MLRRLVPLVLLPAVLVFAGCGSGGDKKKSSTPATVNPAGESSKTACRKVRAPRPKRGLRLKAPQTELRLTKSYTAQVVTSCGTFTIGLDVRRARKTASSFAYLANKRFYDQTLFHRVVVGFVIQGGDPLGNGQGGPGYRVVQPPPSSLRYTRGVVAMAKTATEDSGTSGSQFFVVTGEDANLPPDYALVGKVKSGQAVVDRIGVVPTDPNDRPLDPVVIERIRVTPPS